MLARRTVLTMVASAAALGTAGCATLMGPPRVSRLVHSAEGGIGGTGVFGPVRLSSRPEVAGVPLEIPRELRPPVRLAEGEVVAVVAERAGTPLEVRSLERIIALLGPVTSAPDAPGGLQVMGAPVRIDSDTVIAGSRGDLLQSGRRVEVSGLWRGTLLEATRIAPAAPGPSLVDGQLGAGPSIGGVPLAGVSARGPAAARAIGDWRGDVLEVSTLERREVPLFYRSVRVARIDGYLADDPLGQHISGLALPVQGAGLPAGQREVISGRVRDGRLTVR